ncbi:MAG: flagella cluster protein [Halarchaeum sp.]
MARIALDEPFDLHAHREGFKLIRQGGETLSLANRDDYECPACGRVFERLFVAERETVTFGSAPDGPVCLARTPTQLLVCTHP